VTPVGRWSVVGGRWSSVVGRLRRRPVTVVAASVVVLLCLVAAAAPWIAPYHYAEQHLEQAKLPPGPKFWLGTDALGRDIFSRVVYGAQISLRVVLMVEGIELLFGATLGLAAGYYGGRLDAILMRLTDMMFAFPDILLAILITSILGPSETNVFLVLGLVGWPGMARLVRSQALALREREFVTAARAMGARGPAIILRHLLPNMLGLIIVAMTVGAGSVILAEATLSFLGIGVQAPRPSWGSMIQEAWEHRRAYPLMTLWPAAALALAVTAFNFLGDGLRDLFDPR
jgi:ABC-type dipeptide/oligopeptide/nickel transport system permease subunit